MYVCMYVFTGRFHSPTLPSRRSTLHSIFERETGNSSLSGHTDLVMIIYALGKKRGILVLTLFVNMSIRSFWPLRERESALYLDVCGLFTVTMQLVSITSILAHQSSVQISFWIPGGWVGIIIKDLCYNKCQHLSLQVLFPTISTYENADIVHHCKSCLYPSWLINQFPVLSSISPNFQNK